MREEWPRRNQDEELSKRIRGDASPPEFSSDPVANSLLAILRPTPDISRDDFAKQDRARGDLRVVANPPPVRAMPITVTRREGGHLGRDLVGLVFEKEIDIRFDHFS